MKINQWNREKKTTFRYLMGQRYLVSRAMRRNLQEIDLYLVGKEVVLMR